MDRGEFTLLGTLDGGTDNINIGCNNIGYVISNGKSVYFYDPLGLLGKGEAALTKIGSLSDVKQIFADGSTGSSALAAVGSGDVYFITPNEIAKVDGLKNVINFYGSFVLDSDNKLWRINYDASLEPVASDVDGLYSIHTTYFYVKNNALYDARTKELLINELKDFTVYDPGNLPGLGALATTVDGDSFYFTFADINESGGTGLHKLELNSPITDCILKGWNQERPSGVCENNYNILKTADGECYAVYAISENDSFRTELRRIVADMP